MALTNVQIIAMEEARLIEEGLMSNDEVIHTYQHWKSLGYQVRRGEKAITKLSIWKYGGKVQTDEKTGEKTIANPHCFGKVAAFFKTSQVDAIATA